MLTASTAARAPKRLGFSMPAPPETIRTSAAQCRGGFRKKVFGPPFLEGRKGGVRTCVRVENPISENRVASCIPPFRTFPGVRYGRARHRLFRNRRYGRMHVHRTQRKRCSRKGVCSGPSAWRPASVEAPVAGVDKVAQPENSGVPLRMWLRSWLRHAKVAWVVVVDFGPTRNSGGSVPSPAHTLRESQRAIV